jgi:hypothetical protein
MMVPMNLPDEPSQEPVRTGERGGILDAEFCSNAAKRDTVPLARIYNLGPACIQRRIVDDRVRKKTSDYPFHSADSPSR